MQTDKREEGGCEGTVGRGRKRERQRERVFLGSCMRDYEPPLFQRWYWTTRSKGGLHSQAMRTEKKVRDLTVCKAQE
jgi:hypothetical protein